MSEKRWFLTVNWCNKSGQGIFCSNDGSSFSKETQHTEDEVEEILGAFALILNPQSIEMTAEELKEYRRYTPLAEYSHQYGIAVKYQVPCSKTGG